MGRMRGENSTAEERKREGGSKHRMNEKRHQERGKDGMDRGERERESERDLMRFTLSLHQWNQSGGQLSGA